MTNEQKLQDYQEMLELVKKHLDVNYEYLTPIRFEVELEKIAEKIDNAERIKQENDDLTSDKRELYDEISNLEDEVSELENEVSDLKDEVSDLKKELKELKNKNLKNNEN